MARRRTGRRTGRRRGARRPREGFSRVGWGLLLAAALVAGGAGAYVAFNHANTRAVIDDATLCPETGPSGVMVVLLDLTDPLKPQQGARLRTLLEARIDGLPENTMISFGVVSNDEIRRGALYSSCKPADGDMASRIYENPALIAERFQSRFLEPMRAGLDEAMRAGVEDYSPIMESLQALIVGTPAFETTDEDREVVIVSDLLQNSESLSFYRGEGWDALRDRGGVSRLARNLGQAWVSIFRVPRPEASATARDQIDGFWSRYFDQQGARAPIAVQTLGDL